MTDYLELPEEENDALLEQAKRLERALSALALRGEAEMGTEGEADWFGDRESSEEVPVWERQRRNERLPAGTAGEGESSLSQPPAQGQGEKAQLPVLTQLRQLDRALDGLGEIAEAGTEEHALHLEKQAARRSLAGPGEAGRPSYETASRLDAGAGRYFLPGGREPLQSSGELTWVEEADRAFRRDSRRYDGGFYLY